MVLIDQMGNLGLDNTVLYRFWQRSKADIKSGAMQKNIISGAYL